MSERLPGSLATAFASGMAGEEDPRRAAVRRLAGFDSCEKWPECGCLVTCDAQEHRDSFWPWCVALALGIGLPVLALIFVLATRFIS